MARHFLGWDGPALPLAATWLLDRAAGAPTEADLSGLFVVLPGARARRVLTGLLVDEAESRGVAMTPPTLLTPGELPAALLGPPRGVAPPIVRRLAWIDTLRAMDSDAKACVLPHPLDADDLSAWSRLAGALEHASDDLASAGLKFSQVIERAGSFLPIEEVDRWRALGMAQDDAVRRLAQWGLVDEALAISEKTFDASTPAPMPAQPPEQPPAGISTVVFVGTAEMNAVERTAIARSSCAVDAIVFAPQSQAGMFDDLGCVNVEAWAKAPVILAENKVVFAESSHDLIERALLELADRSEPVDVGDVVIGVVDPALLALLRHRAAMAAGVTLRSATGDPALRTPPGRLLTLLSNHLRERTFDTLGALARHPDVEAALVAQLQTTGAESSENAQGASASERAPTEWWLARLDEIRREHMTLDSAAAPPALGQQEAEALRFVRARLVDLLGDLAVSPEQARPLSEWAEALESALRSMYAGRSLDPEIEADRRLIEGLKAVRAALDELAELTPLTNDNATTGQTKRSSAGASPALPVATVWQAIAFLEERLERTFVPDPTSRDAIETLGWLDLALDPSPICVVVGMAEAHVPDSVTHDPLIPGALRDRLGLTTNESRLARDAYLLSAMSASRDAVFLTARRGDEGDPQTPSRLLFRCAGKTLAQRVRRFTQPDLEPKANRTLASLVVPGAEDRFAPPLIVGPDYTPPTSMRITDFDSYLRSPAAWYLERSLRLKEIDEPPRELSPMLFGSLAHATLESFGRDESSRDLDDPAPLAEALSELLDTAARRMFGDRLPVAVRLQVELLRVRLDLFARWQAKRRRDGWRIERVEWSPKRDDPAAVIDVDSEPMRLRGKIDRIDVNDAGQWAIIDYKTGGPAAKEITKCRNKYQQWLRLQLPLYRRLVGSLDPPERVELGYAGLPASDSEPAWSFAAWSRDDLAGADEAARDVVRQIRHLKPGDVVELGDHPPDRGVLGFVTGQRFDLGGRAVEVDAAAATEEES